VALGANEIIRVCAAVVRDDAILMVEHRHDERVYWTLPGGGVERGETAEVAVVRELFEETGLVGHVVRVLFDEPHPQRDGVVRCFEVAVEPSAVARLGTDPELASDEQMLTAIAWRSLAELGDDRQVREVTAALRDGGNR